MSSKDGKELAQASGDTRMPLLQRVSVTASEDLDTDRRDCVRMSAFLQLPYCSCSPHVLQFVPILPGTTMVIVSEVRPRHV